MHRAIRHAVQGHCVGTVGNVALRVSASLHARGDEYDDGEPVERMSKTRGKKEASLATDLGLRLAGLSKKQLDYVGESAGLSADIMEAVRMFQRIEHKGKNGMRRQMLLMGKLLRTVEAGPVEEALLRVQDGVPLPVPIATLAGEMVPLPTLQPRGAEGDAARPDAPVGPEDPDGVTQAREGNRPEAATDVLATWFEGLLSDDRAVTTEVFEYRDEFDRQRLRQLIRAAKMERAANMALLEAAKVQVQEPAVASTTVGVSAGAVTSPARPKTKVAKELLKFLTELHKSPR
eukprot:jgi/Mesvir1/11768/Mv00135-RA.1